ncbi:MAG: hypothetical protein H7325_05440 [Pedobacter sp.]|nr:hypothetical protein [Pedobacter sp.]
MKGIKIFILLMCLYSTSFSQSYFPTLERNLDNYYQETESRLLSNSINKLHQDSVAVDMVTIEVYQKKAVSEEKVKKLISNFNLKKGSWNDINYADDKVSGWEPMTHASRILYLTSLYTNKKSKFYEDETIKTILHLSLKFWFDANLTCKNWWYNQIGIPKTLGPAFIMLKNELSKNEIAAAVKVLNHSVIGMTGQNKVWLAGNVLFKAILLEDENLAKLARDSIFAELKTSKAEGIQQDYSFHQHGPQQQFGNYGLSFVNTMSFWSRIFSETPLKIDDERLSNLRNLMLEGFNWVTWKGHFDINSVGRQFFKNVDKSKALALAYSMLDMTYVDPANAMQYEDFISRNYGNLFLPHFSGTKHFWRSDMTVHRSPNWFASLKMSSNRVQATEALNKENLKGYFMGDGTYFVEVDGDEYEEIFPYLNWKKLPGVTNFQTSAPLKVLNSRGYRNKGDFTGGVVSGENGITSFRLNRDSLTGNKTTFWLNNKMICLGAHIYSDLKMPIFTTINQTRLNGPVYIYDDNVKLLKNEQYDSKSVKWVYHNKIGYYNLQPSIFSVTTQNQTGSWGEIAFVYNQDKPITKPVFTLGINQGIADKPLNYAYALIPDINLEALKTFKPDFSIIQNNEEAQVITSNDGSILMLAIFKPTCIKALSFPSLEFSSAGLFILAKSQDGWTASIADPTQQLNVMKWKIADKEQSTHLPQGLDRGKSIKTKIDSRLK